MILVRLEKLTRLRQELRAVRYARELGQRNGGLDSHLVLEIGVDRFPMNLLDRHEAQPPTTARTGQASTPNVRRINSVH